MADGRTKNRWARLDPVLNAWSRLDLTTQAVIGVVVALMIAAAFVFIGAPGKLDQNPIVPRSSTRGTSTTIPTQESKAEDRFLAGIDGDVTLSGLDYQKVERADLLAAGKRFCADVAVLPPGVKRPGGLLNNSDFRRAADKIATRFPAITNTDRSATNGATLLAYAVGTSAVTELCPRYESSLG